MRDLFETELGMDKVSTQNTAPRDLLADEPLPTYQSQIEHSKADNSGRTEDEQQLIDALFTPEELEEIENERPMGLLEGIKKKGVSAAFGEQWSEFKSNLKGKGWEHMLPYVGTGEDIAEAGVDLHMISKAKDGDPAAMKYVKDMLKEDMRNQMRGTTISGQVGNIMHYAPAFMGEMAVAAFTMGGGATPKAAQVATEGAVSVGKKALAKKLVKDAATTVAKGSAKAGVVALKMPQMTAKNYLERRVAGSIEATDKGQFLIKDMDENPATTTAKAFADTWVSVASEMSGEKILAGAGKAVSPLTKAASKVTSPAFAKLNSALPAKFKDGVLREVMKFKPDAKISKLLSDRVYFNGVLGEMAEERLEGVMRATLQLNDDDFKNGKGTADQLMEAIFPDKDQLLAEAGAFSMIGVASHSSVRSANWLASKGVSIEKAREIIGTMSETQKDQLADQINKIARPLETVEFPIENIKFSKDVPNFKEGANEFGVVAGERLQGEYNRTGTAPIVLWERNNGDVEIITGRHRLDLAKRNGEKTIPSQILRESEGVTADEARLIDIEQNMREEKGSTKDYVRFFKEKNWDEAKVTSEGLISRARNQDAFAIARHASEGVYSAFMDDKISPTQAAAIAKGAPNDEAAQAAGLKAANKMNASELEAYVSLLSNAERQKEQSGDLFGFDDGVIKEAEAIAKLVAKHKKAIDEKISAVRGALKNPKIAEEMGLSFNITPENIEKEVENLTFQKKSLDKFYQNEGLMNYYRSLLKESKDPAKIDFKQQTLAADMLLDATPENKAKAELEAKLTPEIKQAVEEINKAVADFDDYSEKTTSAISRHWFDCLRALHDIDEGIYQKARIHAGIGGRVIEVIEDSIRKQDKDGNWQKVGEGLLPILKDFEVEFGKTLDETEKDLGGYMIAKRYLEDLKGREDVEVSKQQIDESVDFLRDIKARYGANAIRFDHYAERLYNFQKNVSHMLVDSGIMSEENWKEMTDNNPHYIPFYRVLEDKGIETDIVKSAQGRGFNRAKSGIKQLKGSELDIRNPIASIVNNVANVMRNAAKNEVAAGVAAMRKTHPDLVREKKPLYEHGKAKTKVAYDPKLRQQLEHAIELLGGKLEYVKSIKEAGHKGLILGQYSPDEKLIRKRLGSQDRTLAHEFGHMLDFTFNTVDILKNPVLKKEINKLAEQRFYPVIEISMKAGKDGAPEWTEEMKGKINEEYVRSDRELMANMFDLYFTSRDFLKKTAPNTYKFIENLTKTKELRFLRDIQPSSSSAIEEIEEDVWIKSKQMPYGNVISYYENGVKKYIEVHKDLYQALNGIDPITMPLFVELFTTLPEKLLRMGTTQYNPAFAIYRNPIRDSLEASINTGVGFKPIISTLVGAYHAATKDEVFRNWRASGGSFEGFFQIEENSKNNPYQEILGKVKNLKPLSLEGITKLAAYPFKAIEKIGSIMEAGTRVEIYNLAKKHGMSDEEAALLSRGSTLDFSRGGDYAKNINKFSAFFNAGMQGTLVMAEAMKKHPVRTAANIIKYITIPSILNSAYYLYAAPDDERKEFLNLPNWRKTMFWNVKVAGHWFMIPKPFAYGITFGSIPQAILESSETNKDLDWKKQAKAVIDAVNPFGDFFSQMPKAIKTAVEWYSNKDFFTGRNIVPAYLETVEDAEQYDDRTSEAAKKIGQMTGLSPMKLEHAAVSIGGGIVKDFLALSDMALKENAPEKEAGELPIVRGIISADPAGYNSQDVQDFSEKFKELTKVNRTYKKIEGENPDRAEEYAEKHEKELDQYEDLKDYNKEIKDISKDINAISQDEEMSPKEKRSEIRKLKKEMTSTAREALEVLNEN